MRRQFAYMLAAMLLLYPITGAAERADPEKEKAPPEYTERMKDRETWEWILSSPGLLLNIPFKLLFAGVGGVLAINEETKFARRVEDLLTSEDGLRAVRPVYGAREGSGLKYFDKGFLGHRGKLEIRTQFWFHNRQQHALEVENVSMGNGRLFADAGVFYRMLSREAFYGFGPDTHIDEESIYAREWFGASFGIGGNIGDDIDVSLHGLLERNNILPGRGIEDGEESTTATYTPVSLPGLEGDMRFIGGELLFELDTRDHSTGRSTGHEMAAGATVMSQVNGSDFGFWKLTTEYKAHIHLFLGRKLVLRALGEMTEPLGGRAVPFYYESSLGRRETIRGFERGRFRDLDMIAFSVEYHYPVWKKGGKTLDTFIFADAGQVANRMHTQIDVDDFQYGFGAGVTLWDGEGESVSTLFGASDEEVRAYLVLY